jgi:hypothetical protein
MFENISKNTTNEKNFSLSKTTFWIHPPFPRKRPWLVLHRIVYCRLPRLYFEVLLNKCSYILYIYLQSRGLYSTVLPNWDLNVSKSVANLLCAKSNMKSFSKKVEMSHWNKPIDSDNACATAEVTSLSPPSVKTLLWKGFWCYSVKATFFTRS